MDTSWRHKLLVASIDFGTTFSGYAVSFRHDYDPKDPRILTQFWKCEDTSTTPKTPTCVLLKPDATFHSFGYEAENKYAALAEDDEHRSWHLFRRFKMLLYKNKEKRGLTITDKIKDTEGREFPAINIFSYAIRYMKNKIIEFVQDKSPLIREDDIYYVLTTPAIWSEQAKDFMRKAAIKANIKDDHLRIALEPECAAIYLHKTESDEMSHTKMAMKPGSCHVIVDLGGGTIDIATHRVSDDGTFEEVIPPCGGPWGSDNINMEFENFVIKISGGHVFHLFKKENMEDNLVLQRHFEHKKCAFVQPEEEPSKVTIFLPVSFIELHERHNFENLSSSVRQMNISNDIEIKQNKIRIRPRLFRQFYEPTVDAVVKIIEDALKQTTCTIDTLCCVGGFSDSYLLKKIIKEKFSDKTVVIPSDAVTAVMKGAVIFGRDQSIVNKRICPYTIGLDWNELFDSSKHPMSKQEETEDICVCTDIFKILIREGDLIQFDAPTKEIDVYPKSKCQTLMEFPFYRSEISKEPRFVTDKGCYLIGSMQVNISEDFHGGKKRKCIKLKVFFGATEMTAEATDEHGKKHQVNFCFAETQKYDP